jgi:RimJ/RimL family protein N-acetyltransferase
VATLSKRVVPPSEAAAKEHIAKWCANETDDLGFTVETIDDPPILVGNLGLLGARLKDRCATVGIALEREHIGRGYDTDAMQVIVDYGFREMGLHRIQLSVTPFNPAGIRAYKRPGSSRRAAAATRSARRQAARRGDDVGRQPRGTASDRADSTSHRISQGDPATAQMSANSAEREPGNHAVPVAAPLRATARMGMLTGHLPSQRPWCVRCGNRVVS